MALMSQPTGGVDQKRPGNCQRCGYELASHGSLPTGKIKPTVKDELVEYLRCVQSVDDNVGYVLDYLDSPGLAFTTSLMYEESLARVLPKYNHPS